MGDDSNDSLCAFGVGGGLLAFWTHVRHWKSMQRLWTVGAYSMTRHSMIGHYMYNAELKVAVALVSSHSFQFRALSIRATIT
jgi:hypothetical protein